MEVGGQQLRSDRKWKGWEGKNAKMNREGDKRDVKRDRRQN